ncbi:MAG TPA: hypothetical protein VKU00_03975 [Chthonomonadaceae bacterium]|nr:hypothetical protein [Chthonomonadaceae bacterium]
MPHGARTGEALHLVFPSLPESAAEEIAQTYRYGMTEFEEEMQSLCTQLGYRPAPHHIDLSNYAAVLEAIPVEERIFYLCDGNEEDDGVCGLSPVLHMERLKRPMIAAGSMFWRNTTHKSVMKRLFAAADVPTPGYCHLTEGDALPDFQDLQYPLFVKPDALYGSVGISDASVLHSEEEARERLPALRERYRSVLVEEFVRGREFTVFLLGDGAVFAMAERRFDTQLPPWQRFISYERSWVDLAVAYPYRAVEDRRDQEALGQVARAAFYAVQGDQYARVDIRQQEDTGAFLALEVNSMPGLGLDGSVGECARVCGRTMLDVIQQILLRR